MGINQNSFHTETSVNCTEVDTEVGPDDHKERKDDHGDIVQSHVVEGFGEAEPRIGNIHAYENGGTNHGKVDEVRPTNQPKRDQVMGDKLVVVLPGLFEPQEHDERLLEPEGKLKQVVELEFRTHLPVWIFEPKVFQVVPPTVLEAHHVKTKSGGTAPVEHGVALFGKSQLLRLALDAPPFSEWLEDVERSRLTKERKNDDVKNQEEQIAIALLVPRFRLSVDLGIRFCRARWMLSLGGSESKMTSD